MQRNKLTIRDIICLLWLVIVCSCGKLRLPEHFVQVNTLPKIYPVYTDITIPQNIAPLYFELMNKADDAIVRFSCGNTELLCQGLKIRPDMESWRQLLHETIEKDIQVEVFAAQNSQWTRFKPFCIHVSADSIDSYLSYRLISPSNVSYEELTINQRCLENFEENVIADNMLCSNETSGQCINCHSYQQQNPNRMQIHARQNYGGTIIAYDGKLQKIDLRHESLPSVAVYPAWHPTKKLIAYTCNTTMQAFHTADINKIEVYDSQGALILYDIDACEVNTIEELADEMQAFPSWAPDGKYLYYSSAHFQYKADSIDIEELTLRTKEIKYNIYRRSFDPSTLCFGPREMVFCADSLGMSATLPRLSPDGRWLLFTMGEWGCFHIWHRDADLWVMDMQSGEAHPVAECNSPFAESYHSWSSNGRWIVFSSRRHDGVFTRPYFAHVNADGSVSKPFELPTFDPDYHLQLLKSYNVPEFIKGPVTITPQTLSKKLKGAALSIRMREQ